MPSKKLVGKDKAADARLRREYQVSLSEHEKVFKYQGRACGICKQTVPPDGPRLAVDHRHSDGLLRGLLCWKCNRAIGAFQRFHPDCVDLFAAAAAYLSNPPFTALFGVERFCVPGKVGTKIRAKRMAKLRVSNFNSGA